MHPKPKSRLWLWLLLVFALLGTAYIIYAKVFSPPKKPIVTKRLTAEDKDVASLPTARIPAERDDTIPTLSNEALAPGSITDESLTRDP